MHCVEGITANPEVCRHYVEYSIGTVTALNPVIGYERSTELAAEAMKTGRGIMELIREKKILTEQQIAEVLDPVAMTGQGRAVMTARAAGPSWRRPRRLLLVAAMWWTAPPEGLSAPGVAPVRALRRRDLLRGRRRAADPDGVGAGRCRRGAHAAAASRRRVRRLRQRHDPAHRRRVPGGRAPW